MELQVPIVAAGAAALVTVNDFQQIPMQAGLVGAEPTASAATASTVLRLHVKQATAMLDEDHSRHLYRNGSCCFAEAETTCRAPC
ncbi:MAG: hypothetical protein E5V93_07675 [Mesorhizobium sp.]|nr:MAG: hypothetical protein E5V93_07675 [Mesorhizobium sp.]